MGKLELVLIERSSCVQNGRLVVSEEVEHALQSGDPVVALESTIITHGETIGSRMEDIC